MEFNLADLFESAVDRFPEREALVCEGERRTYAALEARANRLAHALRDAGIGPGDHVGIYAQNRAEWVEALWAIFKLRAVWININYRYVREELRYLMGNADLRALVVERQYAGRAAEVREALPLLGRVFLLEDGSDAPPPDGLDWTPYEAALAAGSPERDFGPRSGDDRYVLYTGGTTGLPKGVVWRHEDVFMALGGGIDPYTNQKVARPEEVAAKGEGQPPVTFLATAPLMHGASQWAVMGQSFVGNKTVLMRKFDARRAWELVERERVQVVMITGDAMGRPLIEALLGSESHRDVSSLISLTSTAATFSPSVKEQFLARFPGLILIDAIGSSEGGNNGMIVLRSGETAMKGGPTVNRIGDTVVLDEHGEPLPPGSGRIGKIARSGHVPLEYYKDPEKTAATFVEIRGVRYAIPGDFATVEADGRITLLGRGSVSINSGGEKIFPEEVEAAVKSHPAVFDCVVVGVPDERWGERVAAVVELRPGERAELGAIQAHCRERIAGYKVPRELHPVERIVRSPAGKPDYRWARRVAVGEGAGREEEQTA